MDNSPTNQLTVSQVADWPTRGLVNSHTAIFLNHEETLHYIYALNLNQTKPNRNPIDW